LLQVHCGQRTNAGGVRDQYFVFVDQGPCGGRVIREPSPSKPGESTRIVMDHTTLKEKLLEAKAHVAFMNEQIDQQRQLVELLRKRSLDTRDARRYLRSLEGKRADILAEVKRLSAAPLGLSQGVLESGK